MKDTMRKALKYAQEHTFEETIQEAARLGRKYRAYGNPQDGTASVQLYCAANAVKTA